MDSQQLLEDVEGSAREEALVVLKCAEQAISETCEMQLGLSLVAGSTGEPNSDCSTYGSSIALTEPGGGYNLMLVGDQESCKVLTRKLFFLEEGTPVDGEEMADALGELVNIAAGTVKSRCGGEDRDLQLGLPLFITGSGCLEFLAEGVYGAAQPLCGEDEENIRMQVVIVWRGKD